MDGLIWSTDDCLLAINKFDPPKQNLEPYLVLILIFILMEAKVSQDILGLVSGRFPVWIFSNWTKRESENN